MIPKVTFHYSSVYDRTWQGWLQRELKDKGLTFPSKEEIEHYIEKIEPVWRSVEQEVLSEMSSVTGLSWRDAEIRCYMVGRCRPISDPLTMRVVDSEEVFVRFLIHELIHQNLTQGDPHRKSRLYWGEINKKYGSESLVTKIHIPVHAFLKHLLLKFYNQAWVDADIKFCDKYPEYKRAWEIVEAEGYKEVIENFTSFNTKS